MGSDHYFSASPASAENLRRIRVRLAGRDLELTTAGGVFSPEHVDSGTAVLLANTPAAARPAGTCSTSAAGWGPIALIARAARRPTRRCGRSTSTNARSTSCAATRPPSASTNINAVLPDDVPADVTFRTIWSNPPIRVGKNELHGLLERWIPRLDERSRCLARRAAQPRVGFAPALARRDVRRRVQRAPCGHRARIPRAQGAAPRFAADGAADAARSDGARLRRARPRRRTPGSAGPTGTRARSPSTSAIRTPSVPPGTSTVQRSGAARPAQCRTARADGRDTRAAAERLADAALEDAHPDRTRRRRARADRRERRTRRWRRWPARVRAAGAYAEVERRRARRSSASATTTCGLPTSMPSPGRATASPRARTSGSPPSIRQPPEIHLVAQRAARQRQRRRCGCRSAPSRPRRAARGPPRAGSAGRRGCRCRTSPPWSRRRSGSP